MSNNTITNCTHANTLRETIDNRNITITNCTQASSIRDTDRVNSYNQTSHNHMPNMSNNHMSNNHHQESNQDSDEESSEFHCKKEIGLVLCCTDHRFITKTFEFLKDHPTSTFNYIILSGASLGYNTGSECWKNTFLDHVDLAIKTNNINKIIVIDHDNCTSYKSYYNDLEKDPDLEDEYHYINMLKFKKEMKKFYPELTVFTHLLK